MICPVQNLDSNIWKVIQALIAFSSTQRDRCVWYLISLPVETIRLVAFAAATKLHFERNIEHCVSVI